MHRLPGDAQLVTDEPSLLTTNEYFAGAHLFLEENVTAKGACVHVLEVGRAFILQERCGQTAARHVKISGSGLNESGN